MFSNWAQNKLENDPGLKKNIWFWWSSFLVKQLYQQSKHEILEKPLPKVTVWCDLYHGGIIGAYFFHNKETNLIAMNGDTNFLWPQLEEMDLKGIFFHQNDATHLETINLVASKKLQLCWSISWRGYIKSLFYINEPQTVEELKST